MAKSWEVYEAPEGLEQFAADVRGPIEEMDRIFVHHLANDNPASAAERRPHWPRYAAQVRLVVEVISEYMREHQFGNEHTTMAYNVLDDVLKDVAATRGSQVHAPSLYRLLAISLSLRPSSPDEPSPQIGVEETRDAMKTQFLGWAADESRV